MVTASSKLQYKVYNLQKNLMETFYQSENTEVLKFHVGHYLYQAISIGSLMSSNLLSV